MRGPDHRPLPLESEIVYGPLFSRRLGISLGINLLPKCKKVCSFDCVYCHYGPTDVWLAPPGAVDRAACAAHGPATASDADFPSVHEVVRALEPALRRHADITSLTFSGNGEPTLHPYFAEVVFEVRRLRDRLRPEARLTLFSNASTVVCPAVRAVLQTIEQPVLKLDAGDPVTFANVNRPAAGIDLDAIIAQMAMIAHLTLQTVFIDGLVSNVRGDAFEAWLAALAAIRPVQAQIYSTDYPVPDGSLQRVPPFVLRELASRAKARTGVEVQAYWIS